LFAILTVTILVAAVFSSPIRWKVSGVLSGEPFCRGYPSSYWASEIESLQWGWGRNKNGELEGFFAKCDDPFAAAKRSLHLPVHSTMLHESEVPLMGVDYTAIPVLLLLAGHRDARVRWFAIMRLGQLGEPARQVASMLIEALNDDDTLVASEAGNVLTSLGYKIQSRVDLSGWMRDD
jgi:hypothetical protein